MPPSRPGPDRTTTVRNAPPPAGPAAGRTTAPRPAPGARRGLTAVLASTLGLGVAYGVGYTITGVRFDAWGAPGWLVGLAGAAPALAVLLLVPVAPRIATRLGTVPAMLTGAALVAATFALMPVLDGVGWWLVLRFLSGLGLTLPWLVGESWINTVADDAVRGRVLAVYTVLLFGGWATGPLLLEVVGTRGPVPFLLGIAGMALSAAPLVAARSLAPALHDPGRFSPRAVVGLAPVAMAAALVGGVVEFGYISLLPVYAVAAGADADTALRLLSVLLVGGIVLQVALGWLADRVDRLTLLAGLGIALAVLAPVLALALAGPVDVPGAALAAAFVLGGVVLAFYALGLTILGQQVPAGRLVLANAGFLMTYEAGAVGGPLLAGLAMDLWPPHGLAVVICAAGLGIAAHALRARRAAPVARGR